MADGMLSLSWNNHKATFCHILSTLREKDKYTDVTVACDGKFYPVHKLVLSTCSEYFEKIFDNTPCKHPVIVLKDIASDELEALLSYMYDGVVSVAQSDLSRLIKAAEVLRIKGLAVPDEPPTNDIGAKKSRLSDDRSSPHPKRRRREEIPQSAPQSSPPSSPIVASPAHDVEPNRTHTDTRWSDQNETTDDRLKHPAATGRSSPDQPEVMVDESLVKEEIEDSCDNPDVMESGLDYMSDSRLEGGTIGGEGEEEQKYDKGQSSTGQLPDAVVEALAGPSGMQGWMGGCDAPGGFSGMEGYSGDGSQDMHPSQQVPPGSQPQAHQMMEQEMDGYHYWANSSESRAAVNQGSYINSHDSTSCSLTTWDPDGLRQHSSKHTKEKTTYSCHYCPYKTVHRYALRVHIRTHTGEKPYACPYCPYRAAQKPTLTSHLFTHKRNSGMKK